MKRVMDRKAHAILAVAVMATALTACSGLSKSKAKKMLVERFDKNPRCYCVLDDYVRKEKEGVYSFPTTSAGCIQKLKAVGAVIEDGWVKGYKEGPIGRVSPDGYLWIVCGSKSFGDVISITTEARTAQVKFTWNAGLDHTQSTLLQECRLSMIMKQGENVGVAKFKKDDSGSWIEQL